MALERLTITKVSYTDRKKDGTPILSKFGKQSWKVGLKTNEYGDMWLNGFLPFCPDKWEGTQQEVEVYEDEWQGQVRKTFKLPPKNGGLSESDKAEIALARRDATAALQGVQMLKQILKEKGIIVDTIPGTKVPYPEGPDPRKAGFDAQPLPPVDLYEEEIDPKDIPF